MSGYLGIFGYFQGKLAGWDVGLIYFDTLKSNFRYILKIGVTENTLIRWSHTLYSLYIDYTDTNEMPQSHKNQQTLFLNS